MKILVVGIPGQRLQSPGAIYGYCKIGWSKYGSPSRLATYVNLCYVTLDYLSEFRKDTEASQRVGSEGLYSSSLELFCSSRDQQPSAVGSLGLHRVVAHCIDHCQYVKPKTGRNWYKTIVLAGGTASLPVELLSKVLVLIWGQPSTSNDLWRVV
ncbi:Actin-related protein [Cynara cardunculus var. scolymus]|uniref:Actin-related protein n=1 Tax=Cynara cardunculus var. scolymus TaxID=59895 RepID=A0A118K170_CYNCS|nr:Actin-related protein [Cynara cardunculus var. scolymus]